MDSTSVDVLPPLPGQGYAMVGKGTSFQGEIPAPASKSQATSDNDLSGLSLPSCKVGIVQDLFHTTLVFCGVNEIVCVKCMTSAPGTETARTLHAFAIMSQVIHRRLFLHNIHAAYYYTHYSHFTAGETETWRTKASLPHCLPSDCPVRVLLLGHRTLASKFMVILILISRCARLGLKETAGNGTEEAHFFPSRETGAGLQPVSLLLSLDTPHSPERAGP